MKKIKNNIHTFNTFIIQGTKEWTTWAGIGILVFLAIYHKEINTLIINVLNSPELVTKVIDGATSLAGFAFIVYKQKGKK